MTTTTFLRSVSFYFSIVLICFATFLPTSHPPAHGQDIRQTSSKDAQQDEHMRSIDTQIVEIEKTRDQMRVTRDAQFAALNASINDLTLKLDKERLDRDDAIGSLRTEIAQYYGGIKVIAWLIGIASGGSLVVGLRNVGFTIAKKKEAHES